MWKPKQCPPDCPLYRDGHFLAPEGKGFYNVALIDGFPTPKEIVEQKYYPYTDHGGLLFRKLMSKGGLDIEGFRLCKAVQCHSPSYRHMYAALPYCKVWRDESCWHAKAIIAMGDIAFQQLAQQDGVMSKRGYPYFMPQFAGVPIIPTIPASYIAAKRATHLMPAVLFDIKNALEKTYEPTKMVAYEDPDIEHFRILCKEAMSGDFLVVDIETAWTPDETEEEFDNASSYIITRCSFAWDYEKAVSFPWTEMYIAAFKELMMSDKDKIFWNANFDVPRLIHNGTPIGGRIVDAMWLWHFLQSDLPRGLGSVAPYFCDLPEWKSQAQAKPAWYSCCDSYATANVYKGTMRDLADRGLAEIADRDVTDFLQILYKMTARGILIDRAALHRFEGYLESKLEDLQAIMNEKAPDGIRQFHPKNGYVRTPKDTTGMFRIQAVDKDGKPVVRWAKVKPFLATSSEQMKDYMRAMKHPVPYSKKLKKDTTEKKFLTRYAALYPDCLYKDALEYRKTKKLLGTYAAWPIGEDNRIHPEYSMAPATGRLNSRNPNAQNIPSEGEMADMFRDCIIASPGNLLLRRDYTGAEALLTGYFAHDELFMKLSKIGVYTYVLAKHKDIEVDLESDALAEDLAAIKKKHSTPAKGEYISEYKKFKTLVLGICYGLGPDQMFEMNPGMFSSKSEARKLRKFFFTLFPKIEQFQLSAVNEARTTAMVKNPFGYIRWLWDVPGIDGPKAIAQKPQSALAVITRRAMLAIDESPIGEYLIGQIHDELILDAPEDSIESTDEQLRLLMEAPIPELEGLVIKTERKLGRTMKA